MSDNSRISTSKAPLPVGLYPHARRVGNLLFLSGVGPRKAGSDATDSEVPGLKLDKNGNFLNLHEVEIEEKVPSYYSLNYPVDYTILKNEKNESKPEL